MEGGKTLDDSVGDTHRGCSGSATCSAESAFAPETIAGSSCMTSELGSSWALTAAGQYCRNPLHGAPIGRGHFEGKPAVRLRGEAPGR